MTLLARVEIPNHHQPVRCPLNPDAICVCGSALSEHPLNDYDGFMPVDDPSDTESYVCPEPTSFAVDGTPCAGRFEPTDLDDLDCDQTTACTFCDVPMCSDHSDGFTTCSAGIHHLSCSRACAECVARGGDDL